MTKIKIMVFTILLTLSFSFIAFANEGLVGYEISDTESTYCYMQEGNIPLKNAWKYVRDNWYYFGDDGISKQSTWAEIDGTWYYFNQLSIMLHDTTTPDGYYVGSSGAWIQEKTEVTKE